MNLSITLIASACLGVIGHGTIILPAMRANPRVSGGFCPYCQGDENQCLLSTDEAISTCTPPAPCWYASTAQTVSPDKFGWIADRRHPDGTYWVDQSGGSNDRPLWCPGDNIPIRYYVHADHNGVWNWESQLASPGLEVEESFVMLTNHTSINNYNKKLAMPDGSYREVMLANYFAVEDGVSPIPGGMCKDGQPWADWRDQCMPSMFAETTLQLPSDMPAGETVLRWRWFGASNVEGHVVANSQSERSLFVSCKDVLIGTHTECQAREEPVTV